MRTSKKLGIFLSSFLGLGTVIALACAGGDWDETEGSMFTPEIINRPSYEPFFRTQYYPFYSDGGYYTDQLTACSDLNLKEWGLYFEGKLSKEALDYWLYKAEGKEVNNMIFTIKGTTKDAPKLNEDSKKYTLLSVSPADKATAFLYYVGFAHRNENVAAVQYDPWEEKKEPTLDLAKQIEGGVKFFNNAKNPILKERYLYQLVRLYYFSKQYKEAISFYTTNSSLFTKESTMKWRTLEYVAGAYYKQKEYATANYLFSQVFDNFEEHKRSAYLSFHPQENQDWEKSLALAKSTHEKIVLWELVGIYNDPKRSIDAIYKLDPKAPELELMLVRLVNTEEEHFASGLYLRYGKKKESQPLADNAKTATVSDIATKGNTSNPLLWNLAAAYLNYGAKKFDEGDKFLKAAEKAKTSGEMLKAQYHIISLAGKLNRLQKLNAAEENKLLSDLNVLFDPKISGTEHLRYSFAERWARNVLAVLYAENGEYEKAEMIVPGTVNGHFNKEENISKMIAYFDRKDHSELEKLFLERAPYTKSTYLDLLGIRYTQKDMLDEALAAFQKAEGKTELYGNPFTIHIKDCHDCDHMASQKTKYTSAAFVAKMIEMESKAKSNKAEAAQNYFLVANGFYNITYYGNARHFYENPVNSFLSYDRDPKQPERYEESCGLALKYYLLARDNSSDKEFRAKCTFMAAKCELNKWYKDTGVSEGVDFQSGQYYKQLKKEYNSTAYYSEIIKECAYFSLYNSK
jgi:hypothetical protein